MKAKCRKKQSFDHFYLALQAAVDGLGVALGPLPLLADELASGRLVMPLDGPRIDARGYWWVARREVADAPLVEQFAAGCRSRAIRLTWTSGVERECIRQSHPSAASSHIALQIEHPVFIGLRRMRFCLFAVFVELEHRFEHLVRVVDHLHQVHVIRIDEAHRHQ